MEPAPSFVPTQPAGQCRMAWCGGHWSQNPAQSGIPLTPSNAGYLSLNSLKYKNETQNQRNDPWDKLGSHMVTSPQEPPLLTQRWPCLVPVTAPQAAGGSPHPYTPRVSHRKELRDLLNHPGSRTKQWTSEQASKSLKPRWSKKPRFRSGLTSAWLFITAPQDTRATGRPKNSEAEKVWKFTVNNQFSKKSGFSNYLLLLPTMTV